MRNKQKQKKTKQHLKKMFATVLRTFKEYDPMKLLIFTQKIH